MLDLVETAIDQLAAAPVDSASDADVLEAWRRLEIARRRLEAVELRLIDQVQTRALAFAQGCKSTVDLARFLLRISAPEAKQRITNAENLLPRRTVTGAVIDAACPVVGAAMAQGRICGRPAATIISAVERLPDEINDGVDVAVETVLTDFALEHDPAVLARHAHDVVEALDQDGGYREAEVRHKRRVLTMRRRPDGSGVLSGVLTAHCAEALETVLDALSAPRPADDGAHDARTAGQRRHDGLLSGLYLLFTSGRLPDTAGCATTVLLTFDADADAFATGDSAARTGHGYMVPARVAKTWLDPETRAMAVLLSDTKGIEAYSSTRRLFTEQQRLALIARDGGCSYWGCDTPPAWTQAHHVVDWKESRRTCVDQGALVCGRNHRSFAAMGFVNAMIRGRPHWIPPEWLGATRTPRRNRMHDRQ